MSETSKDQIIKRIQALMAKSIENGATISESEAAAEKVSELIAKYQIAQGDLVPKDDKYVQQLAPFKTKMKQSWEVELASTIASITGTFVAYSQRHAHFYGRQSDVEIAVFYFAQMERRVDSLGHAEYRHQAAMGYDGAKENSWVHSFNIGFAKGLRAKMSSARQAAAQGNSTALMVLDNRGQQARGWAHSTERFTNTKRSRPKTTAGLGYGYQAGLETNLHEGLKEGKPTSKIGGG